MSTSATFVVSDSTTEDGIQTSFMPSESENMVPCGDPTWASKVLLMRIGRTT